MTNRPAPRFFIGLRNAVILGGLFWVLVIWAAKALADPPDNRPPGGDVVGGDVTGSVDSVIENSVDVSNVADASATIEAGAMQSGDQSVNLDSKSLALVNTMGDVDINDCRESEQFGTPVFSRQWVNLNPWCAAEVYDAKGLHELAARTRCTIKEIGRLFDNTDACVAANTVEVAPPPPPPVVSHDRDDELERRLEMTMDYAAELESRLNALAERQPEQRTIVQQKPLLTEKQRAALQEVLNDEQR